MFTVKFVQNSCGPNSDYVFFFIGFEDGGVYSRTCPVDRAVRTKYNILRRWQPGDHGSFLFLTLQCCEHAYRSLAFQI